MKKICLAVLFIVVLMWASQPQVHAQTANPRETLNQYVSDLQKNQNDYALREKTIKLAQTMKPAPAIPEGAREHYVMAATFMEQAKDNNGYERAIGEYRAALLAAPWWADAYKKLAIIQKAAARYDDAVASLNLYLLTQPADARDAQDEIYKLKALKQTAADNEARRQQVEQRAREESPEGKLEALLRKIDSRRYIGPPITNGNGGDRTNLAVDVRGKVFVVGSVPEGRGFFEASGDSRIEIVGRETRTTQATAWGPAEATWVISEDGDRISRRLRWSDGDVREDVYLRQR